MAIIRKDDRKLVAIHSAALTNKPAICGMKPIVNREGLLVDGDGDVPLEALRIELRLEPDADPEEVLVAASRRLMDLRRQATERYVADRIGEAIQAGKLSRRSVRGPRRWSRGRETCLTSGFAPRRW